MSFARVASMHPVCKRTEGSAGQRHSSIQCHAEMPALTEKLERALVCATLIAIAQQQHREHGATGRSKTAV
jgi:hypothetical protein